MKPMTVGALRRALAEMDDNTEVIDAATGRALVDVDTDQGGAVELTFADTRRHRSMTNTFVGEFNGGLLVQIGSSDHYGDLHM